MKDNTVKTIMLTKAEDDVISCAFQEVLYVNLRQGYAVWTKYTIVILSAATLAF